MTQVLITESYLEDIADAIREKSGSESTYTPAQMATAIENIPSAEEPDLVTKAIVANGTYAAEDEGHDGYSQVAVQVPNSYAASDEGKVVSNGALVAQTSVTKTANGTYDTTLNNEVVVNVSGGGGGSNAFAEFDFTKLTGTIKGVTYGSSGAVFDNASDYILVPIGKSDMTIEIDVGQMQLTSGTHRRFVMGSSTNGFIYRSTGKWAFYAGNWEEFTETDVSLFANSKVQIYVDSNNKWHIYKDGILLFEPSAALALNAGSGENSNTWYIGSPQGQSIYDSVIKAIRLYDGEHIL